MTGASFPYSPAVTEAMARGRVTMAGVVATLISLGSRGHVEFEERDRGLHGVRVAVLPSAGLLPTEEWLLAGMRRWVERQVAPQWGEWTGVLGDQAAAEGAFTADQWEPLRRRTWLGAVIWDAVRGGLAEDVAAFAASLRGFPVEDEPLPQSRNDWDATLAYAVSLGQGDSFLVRARRVNEYYARHFQGVVMTFYTPQWYRPLVIEGRERFAFLTDGLGLFVRRFGWDRLVPQ